MPVKRIIDYFCGARSVMLQGAHCEQVLNVLRRHNVQMQKIKRIDEQTISFTLLSKDVKQLDCVCKRYCVTIKLQGIFGFPRWYYRYKKRWGIAAGLLMTTVFILVINCFVWDVQVSGCADRTTEAEILRQFKELGFGVGSFRFGWDLSQLENRFMMKNKDVIWVSVNMHFTTADIQLQERSLKSERYYDYSTPCDIYAARDGQIVSMMVSSGTALVSEGDAVRAGEMLVSREYIGKHGEKIIVPSIARIEAKTQRSIQVTVPLVKEKHTPTGKKRTIFELNIFNFKIPLYFKDNISYNKYDYTEKRTVLKLWKNLALPVSVLSKTYTEVMVSEDREDPHRAGQLARVQLDQQEKAELFAVKIQNRKVEEKIQDDRLVLTATYTCLEDIAQPLGK